MEVNKSMELLKELLKDKSTIYDANYCLATSQALKNVLSEIDRLQKENKELKKGQNSLIQSKKKWKDRYYREKVTKEEVEELLENSIPKEKIENEIKELEKGVIFDNLIRLYTLRDSYELQISVLKELLEEEK